MKKDAVVMEVRFHLNSAEGDRGSGEGRVDLGIIQWWNKEDDDQEND